MHTVGNKTKLLWQLFYEFFKIALFVVGGGYAIIVVADDVFGRRLKWTKEGELIEHLPVFQMVPGLIAGNTAIYLGLKMAGLVGAAVSLLAVALPSLIIFLIVACGYDSLPLGDPLLESAFLGLRSSLTGIIAGTVIAGWKKSIKGVYGYAAMLVGAVVLVLGYANTIEVLIAAAAIGIVLEFCGLGAQSDISGGVPMPPLKLKRPWIPAVILVAFLVGVTLLHGPLFWIFSKFGLMCFGGGFVLIPAYMDQFVGPEASMLNLPVEEFSNLMALTQVTPGPVRVNSATFFGYRLGSFSGAVVATAGLLMPSYFLLTAALTSLDKWKSSRLVRGLLRGIRPATVALMISALIVFGGMSVWNYSPETGLAGLTFSPMAIAIAAFSLYVILRKKLSVMATIFLSAIVGLAWGYFATP